MVLTPMSGMSQKGDKMSDIKYDYKQCIDIIKKQLTISYSEYTQNKGYTYDELIGLIMWEMNVSKSIAVSYRNYLYLKSWIKRGKKGYFIQSQKGYYTLGEKRINKQFT